MIWGGTVRFTVFGSQPSRTTKPSALLQSLASAVLLQLYQNKTNLIPCSTDSNLIGGRVTVI